MTNADSSDEEATGAEKEEGCQTTVTRLKAVGKKNDNEHCDINFVKDTHYYLLASDTKRQWGSCTAVDPAPPVHENYEDSCEPGDYLLIAGKDINLKSTGANYTTASFDPDDELILTSDWTRFEEEMTGQDLADLEDETFLLWWQNVKPPPPPKPSRAPIPKKKPPSKPKAKTKR